MSTKKAPFVSILTPVYNGEKYIEECIESVLNQSYSNWEYVIVNNRSSDRTSKIAEKYAHQDDRIRIHNNREHLSVMENLNHAFRQISPKSKYCKVIHADDWLFPECVERMVELAEKHPSVGIVSSFRMIENEVGPAGLHYSRSCISGKEICRRYLLNGEYYFGAPSTILLRSDLIRKRKKIYDESYIQSDVSACLDILKESDFGFIHQVLSFTRRHEKSVSERIAQKFSTYMFGDLKTHLSYGPYYLTAEELKKRIQERINIFYIQFARNILFGNTDQAYRRHKSELKSLDLPLKHVKLLKHLMIESVKYPVKKILQNRGFIQQI